MPLHTKHKFFVRCPNGLDNAVGRAGADIKIFADVVHRLMVDGVGCDNINPQQPRQRAAQKDLMSGRVAGFVLFMSVDMLKQIAAAQYVKQLHPAANAQYWHVAL